MNEFTENKAEVPPVQEYSQPAENQEYSLNTALNAFKEFDSSTDKKIIEASIAETKEKANVREYGVKACCDAAKESFTKEVLADWGKMSDKQREKIVTEYAGKIGNGLNIDYKGIVYEKMSPNIAGYNKGDGHVYLNKELLKHPAAVGHIIDTVAHEARHQMQSEAIKNPEKFGVDKATVNEWKYATETYTQDNATAKDPWGYHYNALELDARYFGETVVRELRKDIINKV
jgi:predicted Zn-dependent protease